LACLAVATLALLSRAPSVGAEDTVGRRRFTDQLVVSEPFVEDELSLPSFLRIRRALGPGGHPRAWVTDIEAEIKKRITENLEFSVAGGVTSLDRDGGSSTTGAQNVTLGVKYQFIRSDDTETVMSAAVEWEIGGTGRASVGAERFDTVAPAILVGQGFGALPERYAFFRPLAVAALLEGIVPVSPNARTAAPVEPGGSSVRGGFVIEYSLPYLQAHVSDLGLPVPIDRLVPLLELERQTFVTGEARGKSIGTVNPGIVWLGSVVQIGVEAVIPINQRTAVDTGVRAFVRFDLDELLGERFGQPLVRWFR